MENEEKKAGKPVGEMQKRRETMPDGKRYIIYYTFGDENQNEFGRENSAAISSENEVKGNV
jgi:hypothetical protein